MKSISGVGDTKLERYGADFTEEIKAHLDENPGISVPDRKPVTMPACPTTSFRRASTSPQKVKAGTIEKTYDLFNKGLSINEIAKERNLATSTITGHLENLIRDGRNIEIDRLVDPAKRNTIEELFLTLKTWNTGPVVEHSEGAVSYDEAKLVRAYVQRETT